MRTLEILTTQNVTIEYPLAGLQERFVAFLLDLLFIGLLALIIYLALLIVISFETLSLAFYLSAVPIIVFYSLFSEIYGNGQSWGKKITGLKIVKINGSEIRLSDCLARWIFRLVDIYFTVGGVGMFLITSTERSQRLGDIVANTTVIKIKPGGGPRLEQIEKIRSLEDYKPVYTQVTKMSETQVLIIKSALEEKKKYPNKSHKNAIEELTNIVCEKLQIQNPEVSNEVFLQNIINDYIVLTR